jgi:hypothetical protein
MATVAFSDGAVYLGVPQLKEVSSLLFTIL